MGAALASLAKHPCYSHEAHARYGRIHLPVARECNLGCNYCERRIGGETYHSYRPAVAQRVLNPEEAAFAVGRHLQDARLTVAGIAGPGEPLCNPETFQTLALVRRRYPQLTLCLSTNGMLLAEYAHPLYHLGVRTLTVTLNAVNPSIGQKIYAYVEHRGQVLHGLAAAERLLENQLAGLETACRLGMIVKINSILIPAVNGDGHLEEVARTASQLGAYVQNIMPLIPLGRFRGLEAPSCHQLRWTRFRCAQIIRQFRACQQCRADAVGIPGQEHPLPASLAPASTAIV